MHTKFVFSLLIAIVLAGVLLTSVSGSELSLPSRRDLPQEPIPTIPSCGGSPSSNSPDDQGSANSRDDQVSVYIVIDESVSTQYHDPDLDFDGKSTRHYVAEAILEFLSARQLASGSITDVNLYRYPPSSTASDHIEVIPLDRPDEEPTHINDATFRNLLNNIQTPEAIIGDDVDVMDDILRYLLDEVRRGIRENRESQPVIILITDGTFIGKGGGYGNLVDELIELKSAWLSSQMDMRENLRVNGLPCEFSVPIYTALAEFNNGSEYHIQHGVIKNYWENYFYGPLSNDDDNSEGHVFTFSVGNKLEARSDTFNALYQIREFTPLSSNWEIESFGEGRDATRDITEAVEAPLRQLEYMVLQSDPLVEATNGGESLTLRSPDQVERGLIQDIQSQLGLQTVSVSDAVRGEWTITRTTNNRSQFYTTLVFITRTDYDFRLEVEPIVSLVGYTTEIYPSVQSTTLDWEFGGTISGGNLPPEGLELEFPPLGQGESVHAIVRPETIDIAGEYTISMHADRDDEPLLHTSCLLRIYDIPILSGSVEKRLNDWKISLDIDHADLLEDLYILEVLVDDEPHDITLDQSDPSKWSASLYLPFEEYDGSNVIAKLTARTSNPAFVVNDEWRVQLHSPTTCNTCCPPISKCNHLRDYCTVAPNRSTAFQIALLLTVSIFILAVVLKSRFPVYILLLVILMVNLGFLVGFSLPILVDLQILDAGFGWYVGILGIVAGSVWWLIRMGIKDAGVKKQSLDDAQNQRKEPISQISPEELAPNKGVDTPKNEIDFLTKMIKTLKPFESPLSAFVMALITLCLVGWYIISACDLLGFIRYWQGG